MRVDADEVEARTLELEAMQGVNFRVRPDLPVAGLVFRRHGKVWVVARGTTAEDYRFALRQIKEFTGH